MSRTEDQTLKCISLSTKTITDKAKGLLAILKEKSGPNYDVECVLCVV